MIDSILLNLFILYMSQNLTITGPPLRTHPTMMTLTGLKEWTQTDHERVQDTRAVTALLYANSGK